MKSIRTTRLRALTCWCVIFVAGLPGTTTAQSALEEIVVTAERRTGNVLTSALSIEVFTVDDLAQDRLDTVMDLQEATPNLTIADTGGGTQSVNIRGIGNSVVNPNIQPGVAIFQDGLIMAETIVIQSAFLDVGTIEVLRGPQGTFVGQSSTGGAVRINSASTQLRWGQRLLRRHSRRLRRHQDLGRHQSATLGQADYPFCVQPRDDRQLLQERR